MAKRMTRDRADEKVRTVAKRVESRLRRVAKTRSNSELRRAWATVADAVHRLAR